jgi:hypothetical protein
LPEAQAETSFPAAASGVGCADVGCQTVVAVVAGTVVADVLVVAGDRVPCELAHPTAATAMIEAVTTDRIGETLPAQ